MDPNQQREAELSRRRILQLGAAGALALPTLSGLLVACGDDEVCADGACICRPGTMQCGRECVDTLSDGEHCGGCMMPCDRGQACVAGACVDPDSCMGEVCGRSCVDTETDPRNCGSCSQ